MATPVLTEASNKHVITVDIDELTSRAERMADRAKRIYDELDGIEREINDLDDDWSDANRKRFLTYFINNHSAYMAQANYLSSYAKALADAVRLYESLQNEIDTLVAGSV